MSEQEMELETAIQQFDLVETFPEFAERLLDVLKKSTKVGDPHEARKRVVKIAEVKKARLMESNPDFKAIMDRRKLEQKMRADESKATNKAEMAKIGADAKMTRTRIMSEMRNVIPDIDDFVASTRYKVVDPKELERKSEEGQWCPICGQKDTSGNIMDGHSTCFRVDEDGFQCRHRTVPKDDLKDYNRKYRRNWKKQRKR